MSEKNIPLEDLKKAINYHSSQEFEIKKKRDDLITFKFKILHLINFNSNKFIKENIIEISTILISRLNLFDFEKKIFDIIENINFEIKKEEIEKYFKFEMDTLILNL